MASCTTGRYSGESGIRTTTSNLILTAESNKTSGFHDRISNSLPSGDFNIVGNEIARLILSAGSFPITNSGSSSSLINHHINEKVSYASFVFSIAFLIAFRIEFFTDSPSRCPLWLRKRTMLNPLACAHRRQRSQQSICSETSRPMASRVSQNPQIRLRFFIPVNHKE